MPEWVRVTCFLLAFITLIYLTFHSTNSKYLVSGTVLEPSPTHPASNQFARGYDVRWGENYAGINSKGQYVFALYPFDYARLLMDGKHSLQLWKPGEQGTPEYLQVCRKDVLFARADSSFEDYIVDSECTKGSASGGSQAQPKISSLVLLDLTPAVKAASIETSQFPYHLIVETIRFSSKWSRSDSAQMVLFQGGADLPVLDIAGNEYGRVAIFPGSSFAFAEGTFMPSGHLGFGKIRLSDKTGLFGYTEEWFEIPSSVQLATSFTLSGSMGSLLTLLPVGRSLITIYRKAGDEVFFNQLTRDLMKVGVLPISARSPLGEDVKTNTLYFGKDVPPSTVKAPEWRTRIRSRGVRRIQIKFSVRGIACKRRAVAFTRGEE
jgi:hypothetical protein